MFVTITQICCRSWNHSSRPMSEQIIVQGVNRQWKIAAGLIIVLGLGALLLGALSKARRPFVASVRIADGRIIQVEAVSFGKTSTIGDRSLILEHFRPRMPQQLVNFFKPRVPQSNVEVDEPALIVWVNAIDPV